MVNAPLFPPDAHGGCPQPRGSGDAIVPEWARRNLVTLLNEPWGSSGPEDVAGTPHRPH